MSSRPRSNQWALASISCMGLLGLVISSLVILSLISVYVPNKGANLHTAICRLSFASKISQGTGSGPGAITTSDFNNDNLLDLAVINYAESTTSVLLGNGNGRFSQQVKLSNGNNTESDGIVAVDLNGDNKIDLVVTNAAASNVGVFLGKGDGTFSTQTSYSTGANSYPLGVGLGDFNHDSILGMVVSDNTNNQVILFRGYGNGTFSVRQTFSTGANSKPYSLVVNDFNKDNNLDFVVCNSGTNNIGVFLGDGTGNFNTQTTYSTETDPRTLVAADLNQDSILDIATANYNGNSISVLLGNGDGTFKQQKTFSTGSGSLPYAVNSGDFNKDNKQDLIVANSGTNSAGIFLGYGNGNFQKQKTFSTGTNSNPDDVAVADLNQDNRLDFITANYNENAAGIFLNTCS